MISVRLLFTSLLLSLFTSELVAADKGLARDETERFQREDKIAIIAAINQYYPESGFRQLNYAVNDGQALAQQLREQAYIVKEFYDERAKKHFILNAIREAGRMLDANQGTLLFTFSGHGYAASDKNYLALDGTIATELSDSGLALQQVIAALNESGARRRMMFIDACRSEPTLYDKAGAVNSFIAEDSEGLNILYSTRSGDVSYEHSELEHGVFTHFLLQGLQGAAEQDGIITFTSLANYVQQQVKRWTYERMPSAQIPYRAGESTGVFVLAGSTTELITTTNSTPTSQDHLRDGSLGPKMIAIPGGCYSMGSPESEPGRADDEDLHRVCVDDFHIGQYEITFAEYDVFAEATARVKPDDQDWGRGERPVININWHDARAYSEWLAQQTGEHYRLPTEAEWEYAARAGTTTAYWWGDEVGRNQANCDGCGSQWSNQQTAPVGSFVASPYGLYDMLGNVWEWTCSEYDPDYSGAEQRCITKANANNNDIDRLLRGGAWDDPVARARAATRDGWRADFIDYGVGFRVVKQARN